MCLKSKSRRRTRYAKRFAIKLFNLINVHLSQKSPKTDRFLREGRLLTPSDDGICGTFNLKLGKLYLIAGNSQHINICNFVKEYSELSIVERRGFAGGYKKGCNCQVSFASNRRWNCIKTNFLFSDYADVPNGRIPSLDRNMQLATVYRVWNRFRHLCSSTRPLHSRWQTSQVSLAQQPTVQYMCEEGKTSRTTAPHRTIDPVNPSYLQTTFTTL